MDGLKEWIIEFLKHRDVFQKKIINIIDGNPIKVEYKDKTQLVYATDELITKTDDADSIIIAVPNTKKNFESLINLWDIYAKDPKITIYFINQKSKTDHKWIICPYTHNRIADKSTLKTGLKTMRSLVDPI